MPLKEDPDAMTSQMWRVVLSAPAIISLLQLFLLKFVFTYETPKFYQDQGDKESYELIMNKIFVQSNNLKKFDDKLTPQIDDKSDIETQVTEMSMMSSSSKTFELSDSYEEESLSSPIKEHIPIKIKSPLKTHLSNALVYGCILSALNQFTGISAVTFYSNELFTEGKEGNEVEWKARIGTLNIGIISVIGC